MNEEHNKTGSFIGYEYHSILVPRQMESVYTDGYENFGWIREDIPAPTDKGTANDTVNIKFKRDRKIRNKAELTRLQRQFDACAAEITTLERSRYAHATITAFTIGLIGCAFLGGATFSYLAGLIPLMVILAVPGFIGWILPYFCYHGVLGKRGSQIAPLVEKKQDEIYDVCEKASHLLA